MLSMLGLTTLQFAAAGLQFWTISYMQVVLFMDPIEAASTFIVVMFSAMIPGVIMGATLADHFGGYKGRGMRHALSLCSFFGFMASIFSVWLSFTFERT